MEKKLNKKSIIIVSVIVFLFVAMVCIPIISSNIKMNKAISFIESASSYNDYLDGIEIFVSIKDKKYTAIYDYCKEYVQKSCENNDTESAHDLLY